MNDKEKIALAGVNLEFYITQEVEKRLEQILSIDVQDTIKRLNKELDLSLKLNRVLNNQLQELRNKVNPDPEPPRPKLVAWIHPQVVDGQYAYTAVYSTEDWKDYADYIRVPWLDQTNLEESKVAHYSLVECNTPYTKLMTTDISKVTCEFCLKLEKEK